MPLYSPYHVFRIELSDDGLGSAQTMEFDAPSAEAALHRAQRHCRGREAELFEDGRSLGRVKCSASGGYWILSAAPAQRTRPTI